MCFCIKEESELKERTSWKPAFLILEVPLNILRWVEFVEEPMIKGLMLVGIWLRIAFLMIRSHEVYLMSPREEGMSPYLAKFNGVPLSKQGSKVGFDNQSRRKRSLEHKLDKETYKYIYIYIFVFFKNSNIIW